MATSQRVPQPAFSNRQVTAFFFRPCRDQYDEVTLEYFQIRCGAVRKRAQGTDFTSLMQPRTPSLREGHDGSWVRRYRIRGTPPVIPESARLDGLGRERQPTTHLLREQTCATKHKPSSHLCRDPALLHGGCGPAVERAIAVEMPERFGLIIDGWSHASEHYLAVFASYEVRERVATRLPLLSMAPLIDEPTDDLSAAIHRTFLENMLARDFHKSLEQCLFIVGHNCSVNRSFTTLMDVPLVGCASHQLNVAVQNRLQHFSVERNALQSQMVKLRTLTQSSKL